MQNKLFQSTSLINGAPGYPERTGQTVSVIRQLTEKECDPEGGPMFKIKFPDGVETDAFECELLATGE